MKVAIAYIEEPPFGWTESNQATGADIELADAVLRAISDGFLVRSGNPKALNSYALLAKRHDARLGIIAGQVQHESARASGVSEEQIVIFDQQSDAIEALRTGTIDAYASTAVGNRVLAGRIGGSVLEAVEHDAGKDGKQPLPTGAFSFNRNNGQLLRAVNEQLRLYLGSPEHRTRMSKFGITRKEIDPAPVVEPLRKLGG